MLIIFRIIPLWKSIIVTGVIGEGGICDAVILL